MGKSSYTIPFVIIMRPQYSECDFRVLVKGERGRLRREGR